MHTLDVRLNRVLDRFEEIEARMAVATDSEELVRLSKEHAALRPVSVKAAEFKTLSQELEDLEEVLASEHEDPELLQMAREERGPLKERLIQFEHEIRLLLLPKDKDDDASTVLEVRAGTGGDEAALFAGDLFRMYQRYAGLQGWRVELVAQSPAESGGI